MNEDRLNSLLTPAFEEAERGDPPSFGKLWARAEHAASASRWRYRSAGAAAVAAVIAVIATMSLRPDQADIADDYLIADALMNSTTWSAPSDRLLPEHQFDIYRDIPFPAMSTDRLEGTLL